MNRNLHFFIKVAVARAMRLGLTPFRLLPIKRNRVLFEAYHAKQYSCNPKYISERLREKYGDRLEIGWSLREPERYPELEGEGVRLLKAGTLALTLYALTCRVVCVNTYYKAGLPRRRGQFFLRTWHGGGAYKKVGRQADAPYWERKFIEMQQEGADVYISSGRAFTELTLRDSFGYTGRVLECGMPRNDMLINPPDAALIQKVRAAIGLKDGERLALFAPTYRKDAVLHGAGLDFGELERALARRFGGSWRAGYRTHHVTLRFDTSGVARGALDLSKYPDMQELLLAADCLITDYSSSIWDMSLTGKPVFLYLPDKGDSEFYTDIHSWGFPYAETREALLDNIEGFDEAAYAEAIKKHHADLGSYETGKAAEAAADEIARAAGII